MKHKFLSLLGVFCLLCTSQVWGYNISSGSTIYFRNTQGWDNVICDIYKKADNKHYGYTMTQINNSDIWEYKFSGGWSGYTSIYFRSDDSWTKKTKGQDTDITSNTLFTPVSADNECDLNKTTSIYSFASNKTIYFDNSEVEWSKRYVRFGDKGFNYAKEMTLVPGTENLYKYTLSKDQYYRTIYVANAAGYTKYNTVYQPVDKKPEGDYAITAVVDYVDKSYTNSVTWTPTTVKGTGQDCSYYNMTETEGIKTQEVTIKALTGGSSIEVKYTDENGTAQTKNSSADEDVVFNVAQTCILTIKANVAQGQTVTLTLNGDEFTSGETYVTRATTTIAAVAETYYDVTVVDNLGSTVKSASNVHSNTATVTEKEDYKFTGWTVEPAANIQWIGCSASDKSIEFKATGAATITAQYTALPKVYFDNTLGWSEVWVYFNAYWDTYNDPSRGAGAKGKPYGKMKQIGETNRYYYAYDINSPSDKIAFTKEDKHEQDNFWQTEAVYRADFNSCRPIFVPKEESTGYNSTRYFNTGYWQTLDIHTGMYFVYGLTNDDPTWAVSDDREFIREDATATRGMMTINLTEGNTYMFKIKTCAGEHYSNEGQITTNISLGSVGWEFKTGKNNCEIVANKSGAYTFYYDFYSRRLWVLYPAYYLKHPWGEGENPWEWKYCDIYNSTDKTYSLYANYMGAGVNYNTKAENVEGQYCSVDNGKLTLIGEPQVGKPARFTFDPLTNTATIENMYFPVTMNKYGYSTIYHKENLQIPDGVTAKYVTGTSGVLLTYQKVEGAVIPKETGVMLFAPANMQMEFVGVKEATDEVPTENIMKGSHVSKEVNNDSIHYILTTNDAYQVGMFWPYNTEEGVGTFTNSANKAYIELPGTATQPVGVMARKGFLLMEEANTPTELVDVNANINANGKVLRNGQLIIIRDGRVFNAQGQKL